MSPNLAAEFLGSEKGGYIGAIEKKMETTV